MCQYCQLPADEFDRTPRVDLRLLREVYDTVEGGALIAAAEQGIGLDEAMGMTAIDGWDQDRWRHVAGNTRDAARCGTTMCVAGWAAHLHAARTGVGGWVVPDDELVPAALERAALKLGTPRYRELSQVTRLQEYLEAVDDDPARFTKELDDGRRVILAEYRARRVMGLTCDEANALFLGTNSLEAVLKLLTRYRRQELLRRGRERAYSARERARAARRG